MLVVSKKLQNKQLFRRLNKITKTKNVVANDVVYHSGCWGNMRSEVGPPWEKGDNSSHTLSEIEVRSFAQDQLNDPDQLYLNINIVNEIYKEMFLANGKFLYLLFLV